MAEPAAFLSAEALIQRNHALLANAGAVRATSRRLILRTEIARIQYCLRFESPLAWRLAMAKWALGTGRKPVQAHGDARREKRDIPVL